MTTPSSFYLMSHNQCLSVDESGYVSYALFPSVECTIWSLSPPVLLVTTDGIEVNAYHIYSKNLSNGDTTKHFVLQYDPSRDEQVFTIPYDDSTITQATLWNISPDGEIYTILPDGTSKYLWTILDGVFVTPDEYLAEPWTFISLEGYDITSNVAENTCPISIFFKKYWVVVVVLAIVLLFLYQLRRESPSY